MSKPKGWWSALLCAGLVSTLTACASSPAPPMLPTVSLPAHLLTDPQSLPMPPRSADGTMTAGQCLSGYVGLLDAAGANLSQLRALIAAEKARQDAK